MQSREQPSFRQACRHLGTAIKEAKLTLLFDLETDPQELSDPGDNADFAVNMIVWRSCFRMDG